jgi:hypothetical protein
VAKLDARLELRLDKQTYVELERRAAVSHVTVAQLVRQAIAQDPAELARELNATYDLPTNSGTSEVRSSSAGKAGLG